MTAMMHVGEFLGRAVAGSVTHLPRSLVRRVARRYIAGTTIDDALAAVRDLAAQGCVATVDLLGEHVRHRAQTEVGVEAYEQLLRGLVAGGLPAGISVKPTALGLSLTEELCLANLRRLAAAAAKAGRFMRVDMEESTWTSATLDLLAEVHREHPNVGGVIQARLRRSGRDLEPLIRQRISVRLCKGIYLEPADIAYADADEIRAQYIYLLDQLLAARCFVGIATHDPVLVDESLRLIESHRSARYEFQMLMGVAERLRGRLVAAGHRVRVYVPYGEDWYGYALRRLQENPKMAAQIALGVFTPPR